MRWYFYLAYFLGGAFLVNAIPHFVNGVSGRSFPTPFASPPGKGQSSPMASVLWGTLNAVVAYFLVCWVGVFHVRSIPDVLVLGAGGLLMALMLARAFGRLDQNGNVGQLIGGRLRKRSHEQAEPHVVVHDLRDADFLAFDVRVSGFNLAVRVERGCHLRVVPVAFLDSHACYQLDFHSAFLHCG
jgi:hypothetical protein